MRALAFGLAVLIAPPAFAAAATTIHANDTDYTVPAGSPVHYQSANADQNAVFTGTFTLTGTFRYRFNDSDALISLMPDHAVAARLPHWKPRGAPDEVWFDNNPAFIASVVPADMLARVKADHTKEAQGHVSVQVDRYTISVSCQEGNYFVHFIAVKGSTTGAHLVRAPEAEGDC